jgi:hypothetical protein
MIQQVRDFGAELKAHVLRELDGLDQGQRDSLRTGPDDGPDGSVAKPSDGISGYGVRGGVEKQRAIRTG